MATAVLARLGEVTNRTLVLPIVLFAPTHRCNSACVSCSWWSTPPSSASPGGGELSLPEIRTLASDLARLGTRLVVFTGGEPLLRPDVFDAARLFKERGMQLHLLTSGLGLEPRVASVANAFSRVIVSLDGQDAAQYRAIRGIDGFGAVRDGVKRLRAFAPRLPVAARATIHARNFRDMAGITAAARAMGCVSVSFLAADLTSPAFGHRDHSSLTSLGLSTDDVAEFRDGMTSFIRDHEREIASGFIAESAQKLLQLPEYYAAINGDRPFPAKSCNAPWMSSVIEPTGDVRPCFFQPAVGNMRRTPLTDIVRHALPEFRKRFDVSTDATCERCVCSLKLGWRDQPWA